MLCRTLRLTWNAIMLVCIMLTTFFGHGLTQVHTPLDRIRDQEVVNRINQRYREGRPATLFRQAGVVMHFLDRDDHGCHSAVVPQNWGFNSAGGRQSWQCNLNISRTRRLPCTLVNERAPYGVMAGAKMPGANTPFEPWIGSPYQVGYVIASRYAQAALRCSYPFDACSDQSCRERTKPCCVATPCSTLNPHNGMYNQPSAPGPCGASCAWPPKNLLPQMMLRESVLANCKKFHRRCQMNEVGPGAAGSFHSELQLDPHAFVHAANSSARGAHGAWAEAIEAIFLPSSRTPASGEGAYAMAQGVRRWVSEHLPDRHRPPPVLLLRISTRGLVLGNAPFALPQNYAKNPRHGGHNHTHTNAEVVPSTVQ